MSRATVEELPRAYRWIVACFRFLFQLFFRQVQVSGLKHLPAAGGGLVVAWHPNGLIDPGLIITHLPRHVVFGARHGLFKAPVLGALMRAVSTVPIYRLKDARKGSDPAGRRVMVTAGATSCARRQGLKMSRRGGLPAHLKDTSGNGRRSLAGALTPAGPMPR